MTTDKELSEKLNDHACWLKNAGHYPAAIQEFKQALILCPAARTYSNLGATYWDIGQFDEAAQHFDIALEMDPKLVEAYSNYGLLYSSLNNWEKAHESYDKAIELSPEADKNAKGPLWDKMMTYLDAGEWQVGLELYEKRFARLDDEYVKLPYPVWEGQPLDGKTLFIQAEQGIGDRILFTRYLSLIKEKWPTCKIRYLTEGHLIPLFWGHRCKGIIDEFIPHGVLYPEANYGIYIMSLAKVFKTMPDTIPPDPGIFKEYCSEFKKYFKLKLVRPNSLKVGLTWSGNVKHRMNFQRTIPFEKLMMLFDNPDISWLSLQTGPHSKDVKDHHAEMMVYDLSDKLNHLDWVNTAMTVLNLDLLLTIDTSIAHLAGALNVPVWNMTYFNPYWPLRGAGSKWWPSMRLFKQTSPGDWDDVLMRVKAELKKLTV